MCTDTRAVSLQAACRYSRGLTLVEILVALLVLSIGLLGLAGLQTLSLKFNTSAYQRTQATALAYDMAERMRANRQAALNHDYDIDLGDPQNCTVPEGEGSVPEQDIEAWLNEIACRLPQSTGSIVPEPGSDEITITVQWNDDRDEENPMQFQFTTAL